jgi:tetratricopeptide (TPR) repeat protein
MVIGIILSFGSIVGSLLLATPVPEDNHARVTALGILLLGGVGSLVGVGIVIYITSRSQAEANRRNQLANMITAHTLDPNMQVPAPNLIDDIKTSTGGNLLMYLGLMVALPCVMTFASIATAGVKVLIPNASDTIMYFTGLGSVLLALSIGWAFVQTSNRKLSNVVKQGIQKFLTMIVFLAILYGVLWLLPRLLSGLSDMPPFLALPVGLGFALVFVLLPMQLMMIVPYLWIFRPWSRADYETSLRRVNFMKKYHPMRSVYQTLPGFILLNSGRYAEAEALYRTAYDKVKNINTQGLMQYELMNNLGLALLELGRVDEAARYLQSAIQIRPDRNNAYDSLAEVYLRSSMYPEHALGLVEQALSHTKPPKGLNRWLSITSTPAILHMNRAWALALVGRQEEARALMDQQLANPQTKALPLLADLHYRAGMIQRVLGNDSAARVEFQQALDITPQGRGGQLARAELAK